EFYMPELPEVETIKNELSPHVMRRKITGVKLLSEIIVRSPDGQEFTSRILGQRITGLDRRGKYLFFCLAGGEYLVMHLRMAGSLLLQRDSEEPPKYTRAVISLDNGENIFFRDPRHFGRMWLVKDTGEITDRLGPEPLSAAFTPAVLTDLLQKRNAPIKAVLLEQNIIAGIGNMYADEILHDAGIHPLRPAASLTGQEIEKMYRAIRKILSAALEGKGASVRDYFRPGGEVGAAQFQFKVAHGLGGKKCPCGGEIRRIVVRNRGTYFCPECQK
ncbi:MAG: bifunctional DNA-formamidopyrimidine glycosylase/DNA-(apurinic or apyrimidinic site) lyase, partial [Chloroflexota bacterium]